MADYSNKNIALYKDAYLGQYINQLRGIYNFDIDRDGNKIENNKPQVNVRDFHVILKNEPVKKYNKRKKDGAIYTVYDKNDLEKWLRSDKQTIINDIDDYFKNKRVFDNARGREIPTDKDTFKHSENDIRGSVSSFHHSDDKIPYEDEKVPYNANKVDSDGVYWGDGYDMKTASDELLRKDESVKKRITIKESQFKKLFENSKEEGFDFTNKQKELAFYN